MAMRSMRRLASFLLALFALAGCSDDRGVRNPGGSGAAISVVGPGRPNIVMIVVCSLRRANLGFAGYERDTTPFIDSLAANGVSFERAVAAASWTKPSTASLLSGLTPNVHGMTDYYQARTIVGAGFAPKRTLADEIVTLPELLAASGYATLGRVNNIHAGHHFNMDQGFQDTRSLDSDHHTPEMLGDFERWVSDLPPDQPFFFFLLTRDAHVSYQPDYAFYRRFARAPVAEGEYEAWVRDLKPRMKALERAGAQIPDDLQTQWVDLYDAELRQLDAALSTLPAILERTGRESNTILVLTADHGERLFDAHGTTSHGGGFMEEHLIHIPLIFHGEGIPAGTRIDDLVRSIDVYPTLAEVARAESPDVVQGRSLLPQIRGDTLPAVSAFASHEERFHVVRLGNQKLHSSDTREPRLYDVANDPEEIAERRDSKRELARLQEELDRWLDEEEALRSRVARGQARELSPRALEELRELGYIE
jgi:arylsulfatase A-like enzyme